MKNSLRTNRFAWFGTACLILLLFLAAQNTASAQTSSIILNKQLEIWKTFSPAGKNFKVSLPAEPQELGASETQTVVSAIGGSINKSAEKVEVSFLDDVTVYSLDTRWNGFGILVLDYKWQKVDYDEKSGVLTLSSESSTDDVKLSEWLKFEKAKMVSSGTFVSEMSFVKDGKNVKARAVATKNRVYMLFVGTPDLQSATPELARVYQAEADKFFNSFQILDNKPQVARSSSAAAKIAKISN
jgi:hypothetical protein